MPDEEPLKQAKDGLAIVGEIIKAAGDSPQAKEAAGNLGQTAVILTKTINNALLPLAAINFAFDKARAYFNGRFQQDLSEKAAKIPQESIVEPKASIAGPTLQGLAFTHEEKSLREMYLSLLATAMDRRVADTAHPAFVEIVKQLDAEDADLIRGVLQSASPVAIAQVRLTTVGEAGFHVVANHLVNLRNGVDNAAASVENPRLPTLIDNWSRLGLIEVDYAQHLTDDAAYSWVEQRPEYIRLKQERETEKSKLTFQKGTMTRTSLGVRFASAVGLLDG